MPSDVSLADLERFLHANIPLARAMGVKVAAYDRASLRLAAPLGPNLNHQSTAFGGSIASLGILAGWCLLHLRIEELGLHTYLVIQRSEVDYRSAIRGDFEAAARLAEEPDWRTFEQDLLRRRKGRISVTATLTCEGKTAATHRGLYAAICLPGS